MQAKTLVWILCVLGVAIGGMTVHPAPALCQTYLFGLHDEGDLGTLAVEVHEDVQKGTATYRSQVRSQAPLNRYALFRHLTMPKTIVVRPQDAQRMVSMAQGTTQWQVAANKPDVHILRLENGRRADELAVNPVLPAFDLVSLLIYLETGPEDDTFDFYLLEKGHQKRLSVDAGSGGRRQLTYRREAVATITKSAGGRLEMTFKSAQAFPNLDGCRIQTLCRLERDLQVRRSVDARELASRWIAANPGQGAVLLSGALSVDLEKNGSVRIPGGLAVSRDITAPAGQALMDQLRRKGVLASATAEKWIEVVYDPSRQSFYPRLAGRIAREYTTAELEQRLGGTGLACDVNAAGSGLDCRFTQRRCETTPGTPVTVDLASLLDAQAGYDPGNPKHYLKIEGDAETVWVKALEKRGFWGDKTLDGKEARLSDYLSRIVPPAGYELGSVGFDPASFDPETGAILIRYEIQQCRETKKRATLDLGKDFQEAFGLSAGHLVFETAAGGSGIEVRAALKKGIAFFPLRDTRFLASLFDPALQTRHHKIQGTSAGYTIQASGGLVLAKEAAAGLMGYPQDVKLVRAGDTLTAIYDDYSCAQ